MVREDRLSRLLQDLDPEQRSELGELTELEERLAGYVAPAPTAEETRQLLERLRPLVAARAASPPAPARGLRHWWQLLRGQALLLEPAFWWAGAAVFALALLLALIDPGGRIAMGMALAAPVLAAGAVAYAFRPAARGLWELERAAPIQPLELLYARLGLVLAGNLALVLALLGLIWAAGPGVVLWRMAALWLGPWLCLTGFAFYATVRWGAAAGTGAPVTLWWGLLLALRWAEPEGGRSFLEALRQRILLLAAQSDIALAAAVAAALLGLLLVKEAGRAAVGEAGT